MSFLTVGQLKTKITPKLHGATLNKVSTIYEKMLEAAATMLGRIDPYDTVQASRIDNAIYGRIYNYTCPTDMKGITKILDMRPIGQRNPRDTMDATFTKEFDIRKQDNTLTIETLAGVKTLRISKNVSALTMLEEFDVLDSTITTSGDITTPVIDYLDFISGVGSLSFGLSGATGQGVITVNLPQTFDLSRLNGLGALFEWLKFPNASRLTNVKLRWGSSASNYWEQTVTVPQGRTAFDSNAWNLLNNQWVTATKTLSPDASAINYLQITINYTVGAALSYVKLDSITASLGKAYELVYYSQNIFKDSSTGALKQQPTSDNDIITLDPIAFNIFMYEFLKLIVQELKGKNMASDMGLINYMLEGDGRVMRGNLIMNRQGLYRDYQQQSPSQAIPGQQTYYDFGNLSDFGGQGSGDWDEINGMT